MYEIISLILAFLLGACLGLVYLTILWFSIRQLKQTKYPAIWLPASLVLRMSIILSGLYFIMDEGHWERILLALAGFILLRTLSVRFFSQQISERNANQGKVT